MITEFGPVDIDVPRDRQASFEPRIVATISAASVGLMTWCCRCPRKASVTQKLRLSRTGAPQPGRRATDTGVLRALTAFLEWEDGPNEAGPFPVLVASQPQLPAVRTRLDVSVTRLAAPRPVWALPLRRRQCTTSPVPAITAYYGR